MPSHNHVKVVETAHDAAISKLSAVDRGYYEDPYLHHFVKTSQRRLPLINRGYFARVKTMDLLLYRFLDAFTSSERAPLQVVSLGAGMDTSFFRLMRQRPKARMRYVEIDYPETVNLKKATILGSEELLGIVQPKGTAKRDTRHDDLDETANCKQPQWQSSALVTDRYALVAGDLAQPLELGTKLEAIGLRTDTPTFFMAECVLIYMEPEHSNDLIQWIASTYEKAVFFNYEQIRPSDPFGKMMVRNLTNRGCTLKGIQAHPTLEAQEKRFRGRGWSHVQARDMEDVYNQLIEAGERSRVARLEMFDEVEQWQLIQRHYCVVVAVKWFNQNAGSPLPATIYSSNEQLASTIDEVAKSESWLMELLLGKIIRTEF